MTLRSVRGTQRTRVPDLSVRLARSAGFVAVVEFEHPPNNFLNAELVAGIADAYAQLDDDDDCRAIVLSGAGRHFCAGVDFGADRAVSVRALYDEAVRLFSYHKPVVAAVHGAAVGGGLGLALSADLRVVGPGSRLTANFARLGIHHGFGLSVTLPRAVGHQAALDLLYRGIRLTGPQARAIGLADDAADADEDVRTRALALAADVATSAPRAVQAIRQTLRGELAQLVREATERELEQQLPLFESDDFAEGVRASTKRRQPEFTGR
jgi:enoyl-CoA hydratase/carnithine racemase